MLILARPPPPVFFATLVCLVGGNRDRRAEARAHCGQHAATAELAVDNLCAFVAQRLVGLRIAFVVREPDEHDFFAAGRRTREVGGDAVEVVHRFVVKLAAAGSEAEVDTQPFGVCRQPDIFRRQVAGGRRAAGPASFGSSFFTIWFTKPSRATISWPASEVANWMKRNVSGFGGLAGV